MGNNVSRHLLCCAHSCPTHLVTPWTVACHVSLSMEFSRQEYWTGLPFPITVEEIIPLVVLDQWFPILDTFENIGAYSKLTELELLRGRDQIERETSQPF